MAVWTDSHCHLQQRYVEGAADDDVVVRAVLDRAAAAGVARVVCVGTDVATSREAIRLASLDGLPVDVVATIGLHPHEASTGTRGLAALLDEPGASRVVAVGECGLDYYYEHSPRAQQLEALATQVQLAAERSLALVLHVRDAFDDLFDVLARTGVPPRTIVHCFTGGPSEARRCMDAGMTISISGIVTFKNADDLRSAVLEVPEGRLLVETDSPFLAPVPHRGRQNEPALVSVVGEAVAALRGVEVEAFALETSTATARVFGLEAPR